jgi:hypothetical protein
MTIKERDMLLSWQATLEEILAADHLLESEAKRQFRKYDINKSNFIEFEGFRQA